MRRPIACSSRQVSLFIWALRVKSQLARRRRRLSADGCHPRLVINSLAGDLPGGLRNGDAINGLIENGGRQGNGDARRRATATHCDCRPSRDTLMSSRHVQDDHRSSALTTWGGSGRSAARTASAGVTANLVEWVHMRTIFDTARRHYRTVLPHSFRYQIRRVPGVAKMLDQPRSFWLVRLFIRRPTRPTVVRILNDRRFGITPERHELLAQSTPLIALNMAPNCSHGCVYCVSGMFDRTKRSGFLEEVGWQEYGRLLLRLAGDARVNFNFAGPGECAEHKDFSNLVRLLLDRGHFVWIQTHGLSSKSIVRALSPFPKEMIATRVNLHLSFHIAAYLDDADDRRLTAYLQKHVPALADLGCTTCIIVPMSPKVLFWPRFEETMRAIKAVLEAAGARFVPALLELHGPHDGRNFPSDYTEGERSRLSELMEKFGNPSRGVMDGEAAVSIGDSLLLRGVPCYAKSLITEVQTDGCLRHCQSFPEGNAGHLRDATPLKKAPMAKPCPFDKCLCVSVGYNMSLVPNGITFKDYSKEIVRLRTAGQGAAL
jgi:hypothetical protein